MGLVLLYYACKFNFLKIKKATKYRLPPTLKSQHYSHSVFGFEKRT